MKWKLGFLIGLMFSLTTLAITVPPSALAAQTAGLIDAGNKVCPVTGDEISGKHFAVYEDKRYGFCCNKCVKKFKMTPEKYLKNFDPSALPQPKYKDSAHDMDEHQGHHH